MFSSFCVFAFSCFPSKGFMFFVGGFNSFLLRPDFSFLAFQGGSHTYFGFRMPFDFFFPWRWMMCKREMGRFPLRGVFSISVFLFPFEKKGGAKNLTVKSILWRGSAYRFLPCPVV
jgi:hypothetical protein